MKSQINYSTWCKITLQPDNNCKHIICDLVSDYCNNTQCVGIVEPKTHNPVAIIDMTCYRVPQSSKSSLSLISLL